MHIDYTCCIHHDINQVEIDYGGYAWTQWMHGYFGDTALHIALKWKRHRAVKAVLSLRPDWTIPNEAGVTAEQLVFRMYGKGMAQFKDEQEREYENDAMRAEEEAMRRCVGRASVVLDCFPPSIPFGGSSSYIELHVSVLSPEK